ncbi:MAG: hypothetical protein IJU21_02280, partial [Bacteroidales bacterium]|nr:hypothetical protein [Bacteroidales bacterium]
MKKSFLFIPAAALLALVACNKESEIVKQEPLETKTIHVTLSAERGLDDTKTNITYNENYGSVYSEWNNSDRVAVYSNKTLKRLGELTVSDISNESNVPAVNERNTSKAVFSGEISLTEADGAIGDEFVFIYEGNGNDFSTYNDSPSGMLDFTIGYVEDIKEINKWDIAWLKAKLQGSASAATVSGTFANKLGFGYFTTNVDAVKTAVGSATTLNADYYSGFQLDIKNGTIIPVIGKVEIPVGKAFYMPLVVGEVKLGCGKTWVEGAYTEISLSKTFTAAANYYYRMGRADNFGPVPFKVGDYVTYNTIADSKFDIGTVADAHDFVYFTPGNLQWVGESAESYYWQLAESQYDYFGNTNASADPETLLITSGKVDLFGWGENGWIAEKEGNNPTTITWRGFNTSTDNSQYQKDANAGDELPFYYRWEYNFSDAVDEYTNSADGTVNKLYKDGEYTGKGLPLYIDHEKDKKYELSTKVFTLSKDQWVQLFARQAWAECAVTVEGKASPVNGVAIMPYESLNDKRNDFTGTEAEWLQHRKDKMVTLGFAEGKISTACAYADNSVDAKDINDNGLLFLPAVRGGSNAFYWSSQAAGVSQGVSYAEELAFAGAWKSLEWD